VLAPAGRELAACARFSGELRIAAGS
jgi:hypothetical protein